MQIIRFISFPFSVFYGVITSFRNFLYENRIFKTETIGAKVISVGNLSVGGTGKTPHVEHIAKILSKTQKVAVLLRGYGRKTKGFRLVGKEDTVIAVGDEALHYFQAFSGAIPVAVCEKRVVGARNLQDLFPEIEVIVLDDAFQHRAIHRDINILLTEYDNPFFSDYVMPMGRLREFRIGRKRADIVIVTKTPMEITSKQKEEFINRLNLAKHQTVFFSSIVYGKLIDLETKKEAKLASNVLLVTGIGNPLPLKKYLEQYTKVYHLAFQDHHDFTSEDITKISKEFRIFADSDKMIVTTEKDAMRLSDEKLRKQIKVEPWCYQTITVRIEREPRFFEQINGDSR